MLVGVRLAGAEEVTDAARLTTDEGRVDGDTELEPVRRPVRLRDEVGRVELDDAAGRLRTLVVLAATLPERDVAVVFVRVLDADVLLGRLTVVLARVAELVGARALDGFAREAERPLRGSEDARSRRAVALEVGAFGAEPARPAVDAKLLLAVPALDATDDGGPLTSGHSPSALSSSDSARARPLWNSASSALKADDVVGGEEGGELPRYQPSGRKAAS